MKQVCFPMCSVWFRCLSPVPTLTTARFLNLVVRVVVVFCRALIRALLSINIEASVFIVASITSIVFAFAELCYLLGIHADSATGNIR